jgi:2-hydroxychromene-2-carboxylate isomerase
MARVEFWFEFASTYSYPAAARIERVANAAGVAVDWRPFLLGPIFQRQGWNDSPFNIYPAKGRYMWRDLERICRRESLPFVKPSAFPRNGLAAARVATAALAEPWCAEFIRRVYHANFAEDREISNPDVLASILDALGQRSTDVLARAQSDETKQRLRAQTEEATLVGIFGAPSFVIEGELFWGNDRLEAAIDWARER